MVFENLNEIFHFHGHRGAVVIGMNAYDGGRFQVFPVQIKDDFSFFVIQKC